MAPKVYYVAPEPDAVIILVDPLLDATTLKEPSVRCLSPFNTRATRSLNDNRRCSAHCYLKAGNSGQNDANPCIFPQPTEVPVLRGLGKLKGSGSRKGNTS
jgi:hypothetical protein